MSVVRRYPRNTRGRDFIAGDLHGAVELLARALERANFDRTRDRLFLTGDLVDRGPDSKLCAQLLARPYVAAVRGNHEDTLIEIHKDGEPDPAVVEFLVARNGFGWWLDTDAQTRRQILAAVRALPLAIEIDTPRGPVGIIHADVPDGMSWAEFTRKLEKGDNRTVETCLTGRERIRGGNRRGVPGIGRVFVGHTRQYKGPARYGNVFAIDTGAVYALHGRQEGGGLTLVNPLCATEELVAYRFPIAMVHLRAAGADAAHFNRRAA